MIPLYDDIASSRRPYLTYIIIVSCTFVWLFQFRTGLSGNDAFLLQLRQFGMIPSSIVRGKRLWTLFSSIFMHGGWLHFLGNMLYLWIFGDNVEDAFRRPAYIVLYLLAGIFGNLLQVLVAPHSDIPTIGASGAISGVMGAYFVLYPRARVLTLVPFFLFARLIYLPAGILLGFWIIFQMIYGCSRGVSTGGGIAYWAHIGGFAVGVVAGLLARKQRRRIWYEVV